MFSIFRDIYQISLSVIIMFRRAQYARWQERLFPADFRGDRPCPASRRRLGKPCGGIGSGNGDGSFTEACLSLILNQVSTNAVWGQALLGKLPGGDC